jgi:RNA polymerase sigma-70 factor (ECF subfamily)
MGTVAGTLGKLSPLPQVGREQKEALLIRQILGGRQDLFTDLIEPHFGALWRVLITKLRNDSDIEDIIQQTVFKAFVHLEQFRREASFRTWLIRIALNEARQTWRKSVSSRSVALDLAGIQVADPKDSPFTACARGQATKLLQLALAKLPETYRIVVRMRDLEERSISEVAEALCLTAATVKSRHHRGRLRMAKFLSGSRPPGAT